jgi:glutaredoxin
VFTEFNVSNDHEKAKEMIQKSGQMGVPVITVDDQIVVGFNQALLEKLLAPPVETPPPGSPPPPATP